MATASDRKSLTCPVCLDIFDDPRLLPHCHHTFCVKCIQRVAASHPGRPFPCPSCREPTTLSSGGAAALRKNFYIKSDDLVRARQGIFQCGIHSDQRLDMYCDTCQKVLCLKCAITTHNEHKKRDVSEAAADAESQLKEDKHRAWSTSAEIQRRIEATTTELRTLRGKREAVEKNIRSRHATTVAALNKSLEEALTSLKDTCVPLESNLAADLAKEQQSKKKQDQLQKKLQDVVNNHIDVNLIEVAKDMRDQAVSTLIPKEKEKVHRPVFRCNTIAAEDIAKHINEYFGYVHKMAMKVPESDETQVERFGITEEPGTEVFSLCVNDNGSVTLSYAWQNVSNQAALQDFNSDGSLASTFDALRGKVALKNTGTSFMQYAPQEGWFITFSKSKEHFSLHYNLSSGQGNVTKTTVTSEDPFAVNNAVEFTIHCGLHCAFDMNFTGRYCVVVEESQTLESERKVRLFVRPQKDTPARWSRAPYTGGSAASRSGHTTATVTYSPPCQPFKPSDVCFYRKDYQEVLLIADEINDTIHVVRVRPEEPEEPEELEFAGYLCPGHPLLVQPTALTVDIRNRVWVACRGRVILVVQPDMNMFRQETSFRAPRDSLFDDSSDYGYEYDTDAGWDSPY